MFNTKLHIDAAEWEDLVALYSDPSDPANELMRCVAQISSIMNRWPAAREDENARSPLIDDARRNYHALMALTEYFREHYQRLISGISDTNSLHSRLARDHAAVQRIYGIVLTVVVVMSCVYATMTDEQSIRTVLKTQRDQYIDEILAVSDAAARYRPLGASYMSMPLCAAWLGTASSDISRASFIREALARYRQDRLVSMGSGSVADSLEWMARGFHLRMHGDGS